TARGCAPPAPDESGRIPRYRVAAPAARARRTAPPIRRAGPIRRPWCGSSRGVGNTKILHDATQSLQRPNVALVRRRLTDAAQLGEFAVAQLLEVASDQKLSLLLVELLQRYSQALGQFQRGGRLARRGTRPEQPRGELSGRIDRQWLHLTT